MNKRDGVLKKEEELSKQEQVLQKPDTQTEPIRESAAGSSSPPHQPPPPGPDTHIHQLPDEALEKIFALLDLRTIISVLSVCQRWQDVVEDRYLNKKLVFKDGTFSTQEALRLIRSAGELKSLQLDGWCDAIALLDAVSARCTKLLHLSVEFWKPSVYFTDTLRKVFHTSPQITELRLMNVNIADGLQFYQELGAALPNLRKLEFDIEPLSDLHLDALVDGCSRNQMEELKAWNCVFLDSHIEKMVQFWGSSLQVLKLDSANLTDAGLARLAGCSELRRLMLFLLSARGNRLSGLAALPRLEELQVAHETQITREAWCNFFSESKSSRGLRKLYLGGCSEVDNRVLASVAAFCPQLEELEAAGTNVTISGVRGVLRSCRKLHNLYVTSMDVSVAHIVPELPQLAPQLRRIRTGYDAHRVLNEATLRRVQSQMPHLRIE